MIRHTFIYFIAFALPGLLGFASFSAYTRFLTPSEYAVYTVGASVAFLVGNVCFGWIRFSVGRFQAEKPEANFLPFALACLIAATLALGPLAAAGEAVFVSAPIAVAVAVLTMAGSQALFDTTQEIQRARRHSADFTRTAVARSIVGMALSIGAAYYFRRGEAVLFAIAAGFLVLGARYVFVHRGVLSVREALKGPSRRFFAYGMPLAISGLVFSGNSTLARVMVANALGSAAAGQFGAALDVTGQLTTMVAGSVCSIMAPAAIRAYGAHGPVAARTELATGLELFLGILAPTVIGLATVARPFAQVVSGHDFAGELGALIPLLVASRGLNALSQFYLHLGFQIVEKPARQVVCGCVTLAINLVLNFVLTRGFGVAGAAAALALADLCGVAVSFLLLRPVFPMPFPLAKVARIAGATVAMALVCEVVMNVTQGPAAVVLFVTVAAGIGAYASMVALFDICGVRRALWPRGRRFVLDQLRMRRV